MDVMSLSVAILSFIITTLGVYYTYKSFKKNDKSSLEVRHFGMGDAVGGDKVCGDKVCGDKVYGNKIVNEKEK